MLIELLSVIVCMNIMLFGVLSIYHDVSSIKDTTAAVYLQQLKYQAIVMEKKQKFEVNNNKINGFLNTNFNDCHLVWKSNGNTSKSGACVYDSVRLTLKVGEGGIGYPW